MKPQMTDAKAKDVVLPIIVTPEQRYHLINDVTCFRALKKAAEGVDDPARCWCEVEGEIDEILTSKHVVDHE